MSDCNASHTDDHAHRMSSSVMDLTSSFSLASHMLTLAGSFAREQVAASNMVQLNSIMAMLELVRVYGQRSRRPSPVVNEALDLAKQVVAAAQAS